ncbi:MAG: D-aminoacylase [Chloroflexi bacterium]|nr:D-aminoacylase [Chloroflexota bacterium]
MLDILIKDGLIIDGSGNTGYRGSVGIDGDRLNLLRGNVSDVPAARTIEADGRVVCPGFIDVHAHSGLIALAHPRHEPKVFQGVTTELVGVDGISFAPFGSREALAKFIRFNSGLDGAPPLDLCWLTVAEYLDQFDGVACNTAFVLGSGPVRITAMGWEDRTPSRDELARMLAVIRQGMAEGAYGLSTGLDYLPGCYAGTDELVELCREVNRLGGFYHTHVRYTLGDKFLDPFREAIDIGRRSGAPVHLTHFNQRVPGRGGHHEMLALVDRARDDGVDVTFDSCPYPYGSTLLTIILPQWVQTGGPDALLDRLGSPEVRQRLAREVSPRSDSWRDMWLTNFSQPHNKQWEGKSIAEVVEGRGKGLVDVICDLLLEEALQVSYVRASANAATLPAFYQHPAHMVGTDALLIGDYPSPRSYGTYPYILGTMVRDERFLTLPEAVRKMTAAPARRLGLRDRGFLLDGFKADVVVFDPAGVRSTATLRQPRQYPSGIDYVIVNGVVVADHGNHTGALPGRALRKGQD